MRIILSLIICCFFTVLSISESSAQNRGVKKIVAVGGDDLEIGTYYLLAIAIDNYRDQDLNLKTPVAGARELKSVLVSNYTFDENNCKLLLDAEATRDGIIQSLRWIVKEARPDDSVLIYYAGHGHIDDLTKTGSWIPWEATFETPARWISNEEIKQLINAMKAKHVLLISDSCFSGDFFRSQRQIVPQITDANVRHAFTKISRRAMTAGGLEPVADGGREGQSVYTWWLLTALRDYVAPYILPEQIHDRVKQAVSLNARQKPMYGLLHGVGGEPDGSFVFFRHGTESLDAALKDKMKRIEELEKLDRQAAEKLRRQQNEIAAKQEQMTALDKRLAELQKKVGDSAGSSDLDTMLAMLQEKEEKARELERLRQKAEEELRAKEEAIAEEKRRQEEERKKQFQADYAKYLKITESQFASEDLKAEAWRILCENWNIANNIKIGTPLVFIEGKVQSFSLGGSNRMIYIQGGSFRMGDIQGGGDSDEKPVHTVTLSGFEMSAYEITQGQYKEIIGSNPSRFKSGDDYPVEQVSWYEAVKFCNLLSDKAGLERCYNESSWSCDFSKNGFRLPTEAEWEYACRAGTDTKYYTGNSERDLFRAGWYAGNSGRKTQTVGRKTPNARGLYDMHGNVYEWCNDWYGNYSSGSATNPTGAQSPSYRVLRGGGWYGGASGGGASGCRSANRFTYPVSGNYYIGFRVVSRAVLD